MRKLKHKLIQFLTKHLLKAVNEDDILRITNKGWFLNKKKLTPEEVSYLKEEANSFNESLLWKLMSREIEYVAFIRGRKSKTDEDNLACHYMFYNLDLIQKYLENCKKL